ncbi:hypothetical protein [Desulfobacula sp.]|uniref:hypothetical protein n=1 Tax=Desulfobacula sp. TaxID=2593537 RepID=UPI0026020631|nr:hypothetical protein [Desulfobacula sp.]
MEEDLQEEYVAIVMGVRDGEFKGIFEFDGIVRIGSEIKEIEKEALLEKLPSLGNVKKIENFITFYSHSSPFCISFYFNGRWYQKCIA